MITSSTNKLVKNIRKLQNKKYRDESELFFVEGQRHVIQGIQENSRIELIIICTALLKSDAANKILQTASDEGIKIIEVNEKVFRTMASKEGPQGIAAVFHQNWFSFSEISNGIWVGLDQVQDPGNLGSILRTLDAIGGKGILLIGNCTDPFHPTSVRASMGAIFTQKIIRTTQSGFIEWTAGGKFTIVGSSCGDGKDYQSLSYHDSTILLMGSEQKGLNEKLISVCDQLIHIPMNGKVDSLNLSNATSIILYEIYNQLRK